MHKVSTAYLLGSPLGPISSPQLAEQVLEELPCGVACLQPQVDAEGCSAAVAAALRVAQGGRQPHHTACTLHVTHVINQPSSHLKAQ